VFSLLAAPIDPGDEIASFHTLGECYLTQRVPECVLQANTRVLTGNYEVPPLDYGARQLGVTNSLDCHEQTLVESRADWRHRRAEWVLLAHSMTSSARASTPLQ
jgi:hypothetical protein